MTFVKVFTNTGWFVATVFPLPSCPPLLSPHAIARPLDKTASEWLTPAATVVAFVMIETGTGLLVLLKVLLPSRPFPFVPQAQTWPLD